MMHINFFKGASNALAVIACLIFAPQASFAQQSISEQKTTDIRSGVIDSIDAAHGKIVVDDKQYVLSNTVKGGTLARTGAQIKFRYVRNENQKIITEILK